MRNRCIAAVLPFVAVAVFAAQPVRVDGKVMSEWIAQLETDQGLHAVIPLGKFGPESKVAIPAVLRLMSDDTVHSATYFSYYFRTLGAEAVPALESEMESPDRRVRRSAVEALGFTLSSKKNMDLGIAALEKALSHGDPGVRKFAARSLINASRDAARLAPVLREMLADADCEVRLAAATTLLWMGAVEEQIVDRIHADREGSDRVFKFDAIHALVESEALPRARNSLPILRAALMDPWTAGAAIRGLEILGPRAHEAVSELVPFLKSEELGLRYLTVRALGAIREDTPDLAQFSKHVVLTLLKGRANAQRDILSREYIWPSDLGEILERRSIWDMSIRDSVGTADYAIVSRRGLWLEFIREDGIWKLRFLRRDGC